MCELCGEQQHTVAHTIFQSPALHARRTEVDSDLASLPIEVLTEALRVGIAPIMSALPGSMYWGSWHDDLSVQHRELLGMNFDQTSTTRDGQKKVILHEDAKAILQRAKVLWGNPETDETVKGPSARQVMQHARDLDFEYTAFDPPPLCHEPAPATINAYSDGGTDNPTSQDWALGGGWHLAAFPGAHC